MKWITNCPKEMAETIIAKLTTGTNKNREIVVGDPEPTEWFTVAELKALPDEFVGLYDE